MTDLDPDTAAAITAAPLTRHDTLALARIINAANAGATVARAMPDGSALAGHVIRGTARHIVTDDRAILAGARDDIRVCYLRVTTTNGGDVFWLMSTLAREFMTGEFCITVD